jgi:hypothetical protein
MSPIVPTRRVALVLLLTLLPAAARAQQWRGGDAVPLLGRASAQRLRRDADTLLASWRARARGVVRMASVIEHGGTSVERVIRAEELEVEVYGEAPNRHKQIIVAWRDSSFLPNQIRYHRDHLGIVANDFGGVLRLGDGEEVRDVVHPLSPAGLLRYEFREGDTLRISGPADTLRVIEVLVRPRDPTAAGTVGTLFIDVDRAALVRFRFTFTPASYRDPTVEDITVTLENGLQEGARWLPTQQTIVIRRGQPLLDLPIRTVLRADWSIGDYELGVVHPLNRFAGFLVDGLRAPGGDSTWRGSLAERLRPLPGAEASIAEAQRAAATALGRRVLNGLPRTRLLADGVSEFLRVNRVGGITPSLGVRRQLGQGTTLGARLGLGTSDGRLLGTMLLSRTDGSSSLHIGAERRLSDVGDAPAASGVANSLSTAIDGTDLGDWTLLERTWIGFRRPAGAAVLEWQLAREWSWSVGTRFTPLSGAAGRNPALGVGAATVSRGRLTRKDATGDGWQLSAEVGEGDVSWRRVALALRASAPMSIGRVTVAAEAGVGSDSLPGYRHFVLGGKHTLPGVPLRALGGRRMARAEVGVALPVGVPTPPFPNARHLDLPSTLMPFLAVGVAAGDDARRSWRGTRALESVAGVRLDLWGPLLRLEAGVSLRTGRIGFSIDAHPDWWPVL